MEDAQQRDNRVVRAQDGDPRDRPLACLKVRVVRIAQEMVERALGIDPAVSQDPDDPEEIGRGRRPAVAASIVASSDASVFVMRLAAR